MASNRPSYPSIRRRQRNIIEGIGTRDIRYAQAAREFGVTVPQLRTFLETRPVKLRRSYNRSPAYAKLFEEGKRSEVRTVLGVKRVRRYEFLENVLSAPKRGRHEKYPNQLVIGRMVQRLYYVNDQGRQNWAVYTREHDLPVSVTAIRLMYHNGRISDSRYANILRQWRDNYNTMTDSYYASWADEVEGIDEVA